MLTQLAVLMVVTGLSLWLNVWLANSQLNRQYEDRSLAVAQTVADMPQVIQALSGTGPASVVQQIALRVDHSTGAAFVVVVNRKGIRLSSPNPALVGKWFHEAVVSLDGRDHLRIDPGKPAPSANARVPVFGAGGTVIGEVSVGYLERQVTAAALRALPAAIAAAGAALLLGVLVSLILARRLKRITFGLELAILRRMSSPRPTTCGAESSGTSMTARSSGSSRCPLSCVASTTTAPVHRNCGQAGAHGGRTGESAR